MRSFVLACLLIGATMPAAAAPPAALASTAADRAAIEALLATYTKAVSTRDEALFLTLLLDRDIPFASADAAIRAGGASAGTRRYAEFRDGVFGGPAFTQRFRDVRIAQDGPLADVTLVFVNDAAGGTSWGWKTLQLLKVDGRWKIASEFYTGHPGGPPR